MNIVVIFTLFFVHVFGTNTPNSSNSRSLAYRSAWSIALPLILQGKTKEVVDSLPPLSLTIPAKDAIKRMLPPKTDLSKEALEKKLDELEKLPKIADKVLLIDASNLNPHELDMQLQYLCHYETRPVEKIYCFKIQFTKMHLYFLKLFFWRQNSVMEVDLKNCCLVQGKCEQENIPVPSSVLFSIYLESFQMLSQFPEMTKLWLGNDSNIEIIATKEETGHLKDLKELEYWFWELNFESLLNFIRNLTRLKILRIRPDALFFEPQIYGFEANDWKRIFESNSIIELHFLNFFHLVWFGKAKSKTDILNIYFPPQDFEHEQQDGSYVIKRRKIANET